MTPRLQLTKEQIEDVKNEFLLLDVDGNGTITVDELAWVLRSLKTELEASDEDIKRALKDIDRDGDGIINLEEYIKSRMYKTNRDLLHRALLTRSKIRKVFEKYDRDNSGYVTKDEIIEVLQTRTGVTVTLKQTGKFVQDADSDQDGKINYEEFVLLMTQ
jgi:calmodulin